MKSYLVCDTCRHIVMMMMNILMTQSAYPPWTIQSLDIKIMITGTVMKAGVVPFNP